MSNYWSDTDGPVSAQKTIEYSQFDRFKRIIFTLTKHIKSFREDLNSDTRKANSAYRSAIEGWLDDVSKMISREILPEKSTGFAKRMQKIEQIALDGEQITLQICTNEYLLPWWLSSCYSVQTSAEKTAYDTWSSIFSIGFLPYNVTEAPKEEVKDRNRIALISRPSSDLRNARDLSNSIGSKIHVHDGKDNVGRPGIDRFGITQNEVKQIFENNDMIFYYGHFELNELNPERSYFEVLEEFAAGRNEYEIPANKVTVKSLIDCLKNKVLFLDACRSIGLPLISEKEFPSNKDLLSTYFLDNGIVCIGTIYPIFDDAAADCMSKFIEFLSRGESIGSSIKSACDHLKEKGDYSRFDWSPYVIVGDPELCISGISEAK
jgi:CHAT domain